MSILGTIDHKAMREQVAGALREAIFRGELRPGEKLQEERLASMLGAGRGPVREALVKLEAEGLVVREPYKGAKVATPSRRDIEEIFAVREILEAMATRLATPRMRPEDITRLRQLIELRKRAESIGKDGEETLNLGFHEVIYQRCPNRQLRKLVQKLWDQFPKSTWQLRLNQVPTNRVEKGTREYEAILAAIEAGDAEAAAARMAEHVVGGRNALLELIDRLRQ